MLALPTECLNRITADPKRGIETDHLYTQSEILLLLLVPGTPFPSHVTSFARAMQVKCSPLLTLVVHSPCMTSGIYSSTLSYGHRINDYPVYNRPLLDICTDREPDGMPNPFINQYIILAVTCRCHYRSRHSLSDSEGSKTLPGACTVVYHPFWPYIRLVSSKAPFPTRGRFTL
jgi:hypothetical protein